MKEVKEVDCKFFQNYKDAKKDNNYFHHVVEIENINYPTAVKVEEGIYHPRMIERSIPVSPFKIKETVYVRGSK